MVRTEDGGLAPPSVHVAPLIVEVDSHVVAEIVAELRREQPKEPAIMPSASNRLMMP